MEKLSLSYICTCTECLHIHWYLHHLSKLTQILLFYCLQTHRCPGSFTHWAPTSSASLPLSSWYCASDVREPRPSFIFFILSHTQVYDYDHRLSLISSFLVVSHCYSLHVRLFLFRFEQQWPILIVRFDTDTVNAYPQFFADKQSWLLASIGMVIDTNQLLTKKGTIIQLLPKLSNNRSYFLTLTNEYTDTGHDL